MVSGLSSWVSWICLLLFSSGASFPVTKRDYPYTATWGFSGRSAPGSDVQSESLRPPLVNLQYGPSANYQQGADPQQASSPTGNQSPSSLGAPSVAAGSTPSYEPNQFIVSPDSSSNKPASAPETSAWVSGYGSRTAPPPPASGTGKTPSFSVRPRSLTGTSGNSNVASSSAASGPVRGAPPFPLPGLLYAAAGNKAPTLDFGDGPVPYIGDPDALNYGAGSYPYGDGFLATKGSPADGYAAAGGLEDGPTPDAASATSFRFNAGASPPTTSNTGFASPPGVPWSSQPAEGGDSSSYELADGSYPYAAPEASKTGSASPPGFPWYTQLADGGDSSSYELADGSYPYAAPEASKTGSASPPGFPWYTQPADGGDSSSYELADGYYPYAAPEASKTGSASPPGFPWYTQPADGGDTSSYELADGYYPYAAPEASNTGTGSASPPGFPWYTQPADGGDTSSYELADGYYPYAAPEASNTGTGSASPPGFPWYSQPAEGTDSSSYDQTNWMPSRSLPDFSDLYFNAEMPEQSVSETSPLPPSSYIIQSRNGYQRAQEVLSSTGYSPEYPEPSFFASKAVKAPSETPAESGSKGGKRV
ncbi:mucin-19-like [Anoplopoma fimbria]|uniref:mucin-19-like n=1 Tax=Anoplopoma fimbria TaxID=229290 RepID=UPI0023EDB92C|nr:mucin-19-like [Anoplopoma fimbria]